MDITIQPGRLSGDIAIIPSKSQAHRLLICAAFADAPTTLLCPETNRDIEATAGCLRSLGADILRDQRGYTIQPVVKLPSNATLNCHDSGSTLRFMLPLVGALGVETVFQMEGRLPQRPLSPLWEEMERMGCQLSRPSENIIRCQGKLSAGEYVIDGGVSSQFITGLLLALALVSGNSHIQLTGTIESKPYITMTQYVMSKFGRDCWDYHISSGTYHSPGIVTVEGDWSNAAFFLAANVLGSQVNVKNLNFDSPQGDQAIWDLLPKLDQNISICASDIPDLVPILAIASACKQGCTFTNIQRLRLKESDRVSSVIGMIRNLGGQAISTEDTLTVLGTGLAGGIVDSKNDHRIAMAATIAATVCQTPVTILGAECTEKSYPTFWAEYARLGGNYEQHLR